MQQQPTFIFGLSKFFFLPHTQYAAKNQKQSKSGVKCKKKNFFCLVPNSPTQMGSLSAKNASKKSHAWATLSFPKDYFLHLHFFHL
jgi:hypothetical protein